MAHDVFISYSSKDKTVADAVCAHVEAAGIRCWIAPRDIPPGSSYPREIIHAIEASRALVLVFSENANRSKWVTSEIERAAHNNVIIIPFRVEDVLPGPEIEILIALQHWLDAITPPLEQHIQELIRVLSGILARRPPTPVPVALTAAQARRGGRKSVEIGGRPYTVTYSPGLADGQEVGLTRAEALRGAEKTVSRGGRFATVSLAPQGQAAGAEASPEAEDGVIVLTFHVPTPLPAKRRWWIGWTVGAVLLTVFGVRVYRAALDLQYVDAVGQGNTGLALSLLARGADVNARDDQGRAALIDAAGNGYNETVQALLDHHADVRARDPKGDTPLLAACTFNAVNPQNAYGPPYDNYITTIGLLLDHGADVNAVGTQGNTPLLMGVSYNGGIPPAIIEKMLDKGANVNAVDHSGNTPLTFAAGRDGYSDIVRTLLDHGAAVNVHDGHGETPLIYAALYGYAKNVSLLLAHGADPNARDNNNGSALLAACLWNHASAATDPSVPVGARPEYDEAIHLLLAHGADPNAHDNAGSTPLKEIMGSLNADSESVQEVRQASLRATGGYLPAPKTGLGSEIWKIP